MKNNKGFSLVELIIVIAICAILIGLMVPNLIKYIEKSNVSSDTQFLNTIYKAVVYAASDPDVNRDPKCNGVLTSLTSGPVPLESLFTKSNQFTDEVLESVGLSDMNNVTYRAQLKSAHASNATIYVYCEDESLNKLVMWITTTDKTGKKNTGNTSNTVAGIGNCICVTTMTK